MHHTKSNIQGGSRLGNETIFAKPDLTRQDAFVGADLPADGWAFFGEFMYRAVEGTVEHNSLNPESFDIGIEGYGFNVGVVYRF